MPKILNKMGTWLSKNQDQAVDEKEVINIENSNNVHIHTEHLNALQSIKLYFKKNCIWKSLLV